MRWMLRASVWLTAMVIAALPAIGQVQQAAAAIDGMT